MAKIDINMDDIVEDARRECEVMLTAWQTAGQGSGGIFRPRPHGGTDTPRSDASSLNGDYDPNQENLVSNARNQSQVKFALSGLNEGGSYKDDEPVEIRRSRKSRLAHSESPRGGSPAE